METGSNSCNSDIDFTPRDYQVELFEAALKENIIVYLPTGSGKTFIAVLLIKEKSHEVTKALDLGGKRTVFLVPTVVLAIQQAAYLRRHTYLKVKEFYGSMGVDMWEKERWKIEFDSNQVLVMTAQVFVDILNHAFFSPHQLNLLVFDECHSAVKDAPMKQVLSKIKNCEISHRPKILGLTAALFRMRCKPQKVRSVIQQLSDTMGCVVRIPSDVENVYRSSTKPCETIIQYADDYSTTNPDSEELSRIILNMVSSLMQQFQQLYGDGVSKDESNVPKHADKVDLLLDTLKEINYLLTAVGPYGAFHCAHAYIRILQLAKNRVKVPQFLTDLNKLSALCQEIRDVCTTVFAKYSPKDRLLSFVQPRMIRLLEIVRNFNPERQNSDGCKKDIFKMCAIVFVERRCMANVLYHFLKDIGKHDTTLQFIKPLFTMGQATGRSFLKETQILNMRQKEIIQDFRDGRCNLLVATSVLEEGIDIPVCNLIIRFDRIKTYCDYVQTKGRARSKKAFYCILVNDSDTNNCLEDLAQFHSIEQQLLSIGMNFEEDRDNAIDNLFSQIIPPYAPFGEQGPRITLSSSIPLINRYCGQLSSDQDVVLAPQLTTKKVEENATDPIQLQNIKKIFKKLPTEISGYSSITNLFQCHLLLPLNSPLKDEVVGDVMPTKRLARRAVALKACIMLHHLKELDDSHLFPVPRLNVIEDEDEDALAVEGEGNSTIPRGNRSIYNRRLPGCFSNCRPIPGQSCFVYSIDFTLIKPCLDPKKLYFPFAVETKLALLTSQVIPAICPFSLVTRAGEFQVTLCGADSIVLDSNQIGKLEKFHQFIFQDVLFLWKRRLEFDVRSSDLQYLVVPLQTATDKINFDLVKKMINAPAIDWENQPYTGNNFFFEPSLFVDSIIVPSYKPLATPNAYYVDLVSELTPLTPFPNQNYKNYECYFHLKYNLKLTNHKQQLLQVSRELPGKNFLLTRLPSTREETPMHLVAELCHVHPLPGSIWKQVVWIPSILHRLNRILVAEELRVLIFKEANIGIEFLPGSVNVSSVWRPLRMQPEKSRADSHYGSDPSILTNSFKPSEFMDYLDIDKNMMWNFEYGESEKGLFQSSNDQTAVPLLLDQQSSNSQNKPVPSIPDQSSGSAESPVSIEEQTRQWFRLAIGDSSDGLPTCKPETLNLRFDSGNPSMLSNFGPSPGMILEALTIAKTREGFDMERMETIGDSILKLVVSIYVYGGKSNDRCDEGRLTLMRMRQINNKHLFNLGQKKAIGEFIVAQCFDLMGNFLPPGFKTPSVPDSEINAHAKQSVMMKNVADCMEALIGVYLTTTGIKGAIKLMNWMGLKTIPQADIVTFNELNGFPILPSLFGLSDSNDVQRKEQEESLSQLYSGLDLFEKRLRYTFKNKAILIEALTHASYIPNRITGCYQRLEFLGDAVLDYLVTRYFYDNPRQYTPAILTDLRSAMVNNETFAVMSVRNRFHLYLKHLSLSLNVKLDRFVRAQEENGHLLMHNYFVLEETSEPNEFLASNIDVPKVLGDIFESVAGAIFVDSGMSLDAVWKSYLPFLQDALEKFDEKIPISALRVLHERHPNALKFMKPETLPDGRLCIAIEIQGKRMFKGAGGNSKTAKSAAAKYAFSVLNKQND